MTRGKDLHVNHTHAKVSLNTHRTIADISPLIFGGFAEHMGRCIYEGIYDPASPHADERGLRRDVIQALKETNYTIMRYPGGNFVSGYRWTDGIGPKADRPRRRALAWRSIETNQFGPHEFMEFAREIGTEPMWAVNLGTGSIQDAADLVEYMNLPVGTLYSDLRAQNGHAEPFGVKYWCLGNEMDGPWQIGQMDAVSYADKAVQAAKLMRWMDPTIKTIACGSSATSMPGYPDWDLTVLDRAYDHIDYFSMHHYAANPYPTISNTEGLPRDTDSYLASSILFEEHADTLAAAIRVAKAKNRSKKDVHLCWDEWNVWYRAKGGDGEWSEAPHILEEQYNLEDALVVATWLNTFLRKADVVKIACIAQIVNVIAPIMTNRDGLFKQTIFYPLTLFSNHARGYALDALVQAPLQETSRYGDVPQLDASASYDPTTGEGAVFLVNRSQTEPLTVSVCWEDVAPGAITRAWQMAGEDPLAANSFEQPDNVVAYELTAPRVDGRGVTVTLPPLSFTTYLTQHAVN
ncbi:alpha-N-arabinofuranosidase [Deinococcus maricopensis]|uniref:non-reducing end alpha-L-arabinofuranosidase n=1 Tax=Deinococcus maricopensis (strain DSM 21211 / LMG 22137 / NRRL B-23946 / LB-34) TaxID=709986 RepID=E8U483_DEIML|nr:alpha-N-arabinofuranosidase [Deinococcus maricopensis]ADV65920.1 alpha-L-arabinofuranosidase domain protein [Deinococcus maricopensis DSM 21211]